MKKYIPGDRFTEEPTRSISDCTVHDLRRTLTTTAAVSILFLHTAVLAQFSGGSGTAADPYRISSYNDLKQFSDSVGSVTGASYRTAVYRITADIDAAASSGEDGGKGFKPIGSYTTRFSGTFHGGGHTVSNIMIDRTTEFTGFFGFIETGGIVDSLGLRNVDITSIHNYNGALAANNAGSISYCFTTGAVVGNNRTGGLVGYNPATGSISNSYTTCSVNGNFFVGGLVGRNEGGSISNSFSSSTVAGSGTVGGFVGYYTGGTFTNSFWNRETGGVSTTIGTAGADSSGVTGLTTVMMKTQSTFTDGGWNFTTIWKSKYNTVPRLKWERILEGSGTDGDPYIISTYDDLKWISDNLSASYKLVDDIDASASVSENSGAGFVPIGNNSSSFTGKFRGGGHTISGLTIDRAGTDYVGLFGKINNANALVDSLGLLNADITGNNYTGSIAGWFNGTGISYVASTASEITGNSSVGGLVGSANNAISYSSSSGTVTATGNYSGGLVGAGGPVSYSYSMCTVNSSAQYTGGLVGYASSVTNSYARGAVTGNTYVGGLAGTIVGSVTRSYSTGAVSGSSSVGGFGGEYYTGMTSGSSCFWDTQSSGKSNGTGGTSPVAGALTGKTTSEMKSQSTFSGWDFTSIWNISDNQYPELRALSNLPLPVELISFSVTSHRMNAEITWKTATELNNVGFDIERKKEGAFAGKWVRVVFIEGAGTTNAPREYSYTDSKLTDGKYTYRLKQTDRDGNVSYSQQVEVFVRSAPSVFALSQNYPNPFNPSTTIGFTLQSSELTSLKVYDAIGREVAVLVNEYLEAGTYHQRTFDASRLASGIYFAQLQSGKSVQLKKMLLMK